MASDLTTMAASLREAAGILDGLDVPFPPSVMAYSTGHADIDWYLTVTAGDDLAAQKSAAAAIIRAVGGRWDKTDMVADTMMWKQTRGDLRLLVQVAREAVCERIVTGIREVTIPAVNAQPERVETVEDVEWRCLPLLADAEA